MRRKLKKLATFARNGIMSPNDVYTSWQSWKAYARHFDAYQTVSNMGKLYNKLMINDWVVQPL